MGNETWKWALVLLLSAVFIIVAHQAYKSLYNADETFPPPDDYTKGDSFDIDHGSAKGPVGMQPVDVPESLPVDTPPKPENPTAPPASITHSTTLDWDTLDNAASQTHNASQ